MATSSSLTPGERSSSRRAGSSGNELVRAGRRDVGTGHSHLIKSRHDIFLSHSGVQKGLVKGLYKKLCPLYSTFFDIEHHSLPPGHSFPPLIFHAANTCRLAVLVLSHDYLKSRWPMLELHALVNAKPQPLILPLFFGLSPHDLKHDGNLQSWHTAWATFAAHDPTRINVITWADALRVVLVKNGLTFDAREGQPAFIQKVVLCISKILPPSLRHDFSGIQGRDRLSEVVLAHFEQLQRKFTPAQMGICVLGMYGPPGSGKSTLSRCLADHYFPQFSGKVLHLVLPTNNPTDAQLLVKSKELFKLTDFMDRVELDGVSNILQVYELLQNTNLQSSQVFLAVDNISSAWRASELVEALLQLGLGAGSKVLLMARTFDILQPLLQLCRRLQHHNYVCACTSVPSLNTGEAVKVLLQSGGGVGLSKSFVEDHLTPEQRKDLEKVVHMSGFGRRDDCLLYLPLVLKIMGCQLRRHNLDVRNWKREMEKFWRGGHMYKEDAIREMLLESFKNLSEKLQRLYLDVALFILPSSLDGMSYPMSEACVLLSLIHERSEDEIEKWLKDLQGDCFLTLMDDWSDETSEEILSMHDVYLEFAASVQESSKYYWGVSRKHRGSTHDPEDPFTTELGLRTVILEEAEGIKQVDFSSGFESVRAMVFRNCKSLTALLGLAGLTSLASLEVDDCPRLKRLECSTFANLQKLGRVRWANMEGKMNVEMQKHERSMTQWKQMLGNTLSWVFGAMNKRPAPERFMNDSLCLASRLRGLQVLQLSNSGIRWFPEGSQCWPLLRVLEIWEKRLEHLHVRNLPHLERFLLSSAGRECSLSVNLGTIPRRRVIEGRELFAGCPKLKQVLVNSACLEGDWELDRTLECSELRILHLKNFWHASELPPLAASAESLEELYAVSCRGLSKVNFPHCTFENLTLLALIRCPSLIEVTGLEGLSSLRDLEIEECTKLRSLSGLSGLLSLESFDVGRKGSCPSLALTLADLENSTKLRHIKYCESLPCLLPHVMFNMRKLVDCEVLTLKSTNNIFGAGMLAGVEYMGSVRKLKLVCTGYKVSIGQRICLSRASIDLGALLGVPRPSLYSCLSGLQSLYRLILEGLENLTSLYGIEFLQSLQFLILEHLPNLSCLRGVESLINLNYLVVSWCSSVEELQPALLSALVNLKTIGCYHCVNLKAVEGCDALKNLRRAAFVGCESLACLPLGFAKLPYIDQLVIRGSKFASREGLVAWMEDKEVPLLLREASLDAVCREFYDIAMEESLERMKLAMVLLEMGAKCFSDGEYFNLCRWADVLQTVWKETYNKLGGSLPASALEEVLRGEGRVPKHQLLQKCHSDLAFQCSVLNALTQMDSRLFKYVYKSILQF